MTFIDANPFELAVALGAAAVVLVLLTYATRRLFLRGTKVSPSEAARVPSQLPASQGASYTEIATAQLLGVVEPRDAPIFTQAPDYSSTSMEIPANASYTQIAVATASAQQRGLKPKLAVAASLAADAAVQALPREVPEVMSYTAVALQTVGEPRLNGEEHPTPSRVDYSSIDIDLEGLNSYTAVAVAVARGLPAQREMLH